MPPKNRFSKEEIVQAALNMVREGGVESVTARALAAKLSASPKVIFGAFEGMEQLKSAVLRAAWALYEKRTKEAMQKGDIPPYKAAGMAYIQFAKEERALFTLLFMRDRKGKPGPSDEVYIEPYLDVICAQTGMSRENAARLHMDLWVVVHGVAAMIATSYLDWSMEDISTLLTDCYMGLKQRFLEQEDRT